MIRWISVGSNIDPGQWIPRAMEELCSRYRVLDASPVLITSPIGRPEQAFFRNAVWTVDTEEPEGTLKGFLRRVEDLCRRVRDPRDSHAPRTLDLDLIGEGYRFFDEDEIRERNFLRYCILYLKPDLSSETLFAGTPSEALWERDGFIEMEIRKILERHRKENR